ncbi:Kinesin-like protein KLP1 [Aduncisulcus paluster]|uniref:Kinesin-like protein n=1 Tax=Aduncisulcus paluster TaxID=2918883 RepID=A0ABQ5K041_9EUKA|nr:Kinesin-like protein KLP1 [Aduncisulcus paluster]
MAGVSKVRVVGRLRPTVNLAPQLRVLGDGKTIDIDFSKSGDGSRPPKTVDHQKKQFSFVLDDVLDMSASQEQVYSTCAADLVDAALEGINGTIFAYGMTGAGKTYTMSGSPSLSFGRRGLIPRVIQNIFQKIASNPSTITTIRVSFLEIYNEKLYDLIRPESKGLTIHESGDPSSSDSGSATSVKNLSMPLCQTEHDALDCLFQGETNRVIAAHRLNKNSTRSHCIFTIHISQRQSVGDRGDVIVSKLNLVDLAGSERVSKTGSEGVILKEANYINKSLSFLEQVVVALSDAKRTHIPYRQSKLTHFLQDSLGGNSKTTMVANISCIAPHLHETLSTLRFAERVMTISNVVKVNVTHDPVLYIKRLEKQIEELKMELDLRDDMRLDGTPQGVTSGADEDADKKQRSASDELTEEDKKELNGLVIQFINDEIDYLPVRSVKRVREMMSLMKEMVKVGHKGSSPQDDRKRVESTGAGMKIVGQLQSERSGVGEEVGDGFTVGIVADDSTRRRVRRAPRSPMVPKISSTEQSEHRVATSTSVSSTSTGFLSSAHVAPQSPVIHRQMERSSEYGAGGKPAGRTVSFASGPTSLSVLLPGAPPKSTAFSTFLADNPSLSSSLSYSKSELKKTKANVIKMAEEVNRVKKDIETVQAEMEALERRREESGDAASPEQIEEMVKMLEELKKKYYLSLDGFKREKSQAISLSKFIDQHKMKLVSEFDRWYAETYTTSNLSGSTGGVGTVKGFHNKTLNIMKREKP